MISITCGGENDFHHLCGKMISITGGGKEIPP